MKFLKIVASGVVASEFHGVEQLRERNLEPFSFKFSYGSFATAISSIYVRSSNLYLQAFESAVLAKFKSVKHVPVWKEERPEVLRGGDELKLYKVYPVGLTQRQALYSFRFNGDAEFKNYIETHPCAKFEAIFV